MIYYNKKATFKVQKQTYRQKNKSLLDIKEQNDILDQRVIKNYTRVEKVLVMKQKTNLNS